MAAAHGAPADAQLDHPWRFSHRQSDLREGPAKGSGGDRLGTGDHRRSPGRFRLSGDELDHAGRWPFLAGRAGPGGGGARSEEHTSELQSLMRISYAVFCLKKKQTKTTQKNKL